MVAAEDPQLSLLLDLADKGLSQRRGKHLSPAAAEPPVTARPDGLDYAVAAQKKTPEAPFQAAPFSVLTSREVDVARLVAHGLTNRKIASELRISPHTVNFHIRHIFRKLSISSRAQLGYLVARLDNPAGFGADAG